MGLWDCPTVIIDSLALVESKSYSPTMVGLSFGYFLAILGTMLTEAPTYVIMVTESKLSMQFLFNVNIFLNSITKSMSFTMAETNTYTMAKHL